MLEFISYKELKDNAYNIKNLQEMEFEDFANVPHNLLEIAFGDSRIDCKSHDNFEYFKSVFLEKNNHWGNVSDRWIYYKEVIELLKKEQVKNTDILEAGPFGAPVVKNSHTLDFCGSWYYPKMNPTILHDLRETPWPIASKKYKWFIALRVFQHLYPKQKECVKECLRIAENAVIVVPDKVNDCRTRKSITYDKMIDFANKKPAYSKRLKKLGILYHFKSE